MVTVHDSNYDNMRYLTWFGEHGYSSPSEKVYWFQLTENRVPLSMKNKMFAMLHVSAWQTKEIAIFCALTSIPALAKFQIKGMKPVYTKTVDSIL